jgi:uncharacterized protein (TIGR03437 family)
VHLLRLSLSLVAVLLSTAALPLCADTPVRSPREFRKALDSLPYRFEENRGQAPAGNPFIARGAGYQVLIGADGPTMLLSADGKHRVALGTLIRGGNRHAKITGEELLPVKATYMIGNRSDEWLENISSFSRVRYAEVYPGIDLVFHGSDRNLEFDFEVRPGGDPRQIELEWKGAERVRIDENGDLVAGTSEGDVRWAKPLIYQTTAGSRVPVEGGFRLTKGNRVVFALQAWNHRKALVIDPVISFGTFLGGSSNDSARGIALDSSGNVLIAGNTTSATLATSPTVAQPSYGGSTSDTITGDAFVAKLNSTGSALMWITYLGGGDDDAATSIAVDAGGNSYITGMTLSANFPVKNAQTPTYRGGGGNRLIPMGDAFVTKLSATGQLVYSTYLGGSADDWGMGIAVDSSGNAYVTGVTISNNFPVTFGTYQNGFKGSGGNLDYCTGCGPVILGGDVFVAKYDGSGKLTWATYLGGSKDDFPGAIAVDKTGNVYVAGGTLSNDFPVTTGAFQARFGGQSDNQSQPFVHMGDGFISKLDPTGTKLLYSTYLGGSADDTIYAMALDSTGAVYVTGSTVSTDFPVTTGAFQSTNKGPAVAIAAGGKPTWVYGDGFAAKLNPAGSALVYSTYFGGAGDDAGQAIAIDTAGNAYIAGQTTSKDFPVTSGAFQTINAGAGGHSPAVGDVFFLQLDVSGTHELFGTYLGGSLDDAAAGIALDSLGNAFLTGFTLSPTFPVTKGAYQTTYGGGNRLGAPHGDAFVLEISGLVAGIAPSLASVGNAGSYQAGTVSPGEIVVLYGSGMGPGNIISAAANANGVFDTVLAGTRVYFDNVPSPMIYTFAGQLAAVAPYALAGRPSSQVQVEYNGIRSAAVTVQVAGAVPGLFTALASGSGPGAIQNKDSSANSDSNPAHPGDVIVLYLTGEGQTNPAGIDGQLANSVFPKPVLPVSVTVGGVAANVLYAGAVPTVIAGLCQINAQLGPNTPVGTPKVVVTVGTFTSQDNVTVAVR